MSSVALLGMGGPEVGLGHVMRLASLAREAHRLGIEAALWIAGDDSARAATRRELPDIAVHRWDPVAPPPRADALILDAPGAHRGAVDASAAAGIPCLVLDRLDLVDAATWTVLPVLHAPPSGHPRVRQGPDWCVVEPRIRRLAPSPFPGERDRLLVVLGGADPEALTLHVAEALAAGRAEGARPLYVVGPAAPAGRTHALTRLGVCPEDLLQAPTRAELYEAMGRARLAICAFGLTLYELAALGTPALVFARSPEDARALERLEALGLGRSLGLCADFDPAVLRREIERALRLDVGQRDHERGLCALGDGQGPRRILELALGGGG